MIKRDFRMPFKHWRDRDTINFEKTQSEMVDPARCHKILSWQGPDGRMYLLNNKNRSYMSRQGPFHAPYDLLENHENRHAGETAFVICPGPSLDEYPRGTFDGCLTYAVNSAGFKLRARYWVAAESNWILWLLREAKKFPSDRDWIMSSRCAVRWRGLGHTPRVKSVLVSRLEEEKIMPHRQPAVGLMAALFSAWWLGAERVYLIGADLSRPHGQSYTDGVPHSDFGAKNPFDEQVQAMQQFAIPGLDVFNASPHSRKLLPFQSVDAAEVMEAARLNAAVPEPAAT